MADILIPIGTPDPVTGARVTERYRDMGDGTYARVVSDAAGGGVTEEALAALGVCLPWNASTTWPEGAIVLDRGGMWQAEAENTNSRPVSGNANWSLIAGTPYNDTTIAHAQIAIAPFFDDDSNGPGVVFVPAPGAGGIVLLEKIVAWNIPGDTGWDDDAGVVLHYGDAAGPAWANPSGAIGLPTSNNALRYTTFRPTAAAGAAITALTLLENKALVGHYTNDITNGGAVTGDVGLVIRTHYSIHAI